MTIPGVSADAQRRPSLFFLAAGRFLNSFPLLFRAQAPAAPGHALCQIVVADDYFPTAGAAAQPCSHRSALGSRDGLYFPEYREPPKCLPCEIGMRLAFASAVCDETPVNIYLGDDDFFPAFAPAIPVAHTCIGGMPLQNGQFPYL